MKPGGYNYELHIICSCIRYGHVRKLLTKRVTVKQGMLPGMLPPKTLVIYIEIANRNFSINHCHLVFAAGHMSADQNSNIWR